LKPRGEDKSNEPKNPLDADTQQPVTNKKKTIPSARKITGDFRRRLPHFEGNGSPIFVTFRTIDNFILSPEARSIVMSHILHDHGVRLRIVCAVVMPDHAHLLYVPLNDEAGNRFTKGEVIGAMKGASAHSINKLLQRQGAVWQTESFDHVVRNSEALDAKIDYVCHNPVKSGLCEREDDYPWLWTAWLDWK